MHILHVETGRHFYGGAQQVVYLCKGLRERGVRNTLVCPPGSAVSAAATLAGIDVVEIKCSGDLDLLFKRRLTRVIRELRPQVVHCHSRRGADVLGGRAARHAGVPVVLSRRVDNPELATVARARYAPFAAIIAISENVRRSLLAAGVSDDRVKLIRSAVATEGLPPPISAAAWRREFSLTPGAIVIAIVAQFIERKGHRYLLEALPDLRQRHPEVKVVFFGQGPLEDEMRQYATGLGVAAAVRFAGFRSDLDTLLAQVDILVHPATAEGLGISMLKAAAAGLPVVAFDVAGAQEAVVDQQTGVLVPAGSVTGLLHALSKLIENPALREQYGLAGQQRMRQEFSIDTMTDRHMAVYGSVINGE